MCTLRRVTVKWPDGRSIKLIVEEGGDRPKRCNSCQMSEAMFRQRDLVPHDDLAHQVLYLLYRLSVQGSYEQTRHVEEGLVVAI